MLIIKMKMKTKSTLTKKKYTYIYYKLTIILHGLFLIILSTVLTFLNNNKNYYIFHQISIYIKDLMYDKQIKIKKKFFFILILGFK